MLRQWLIDRTIETVLQWLILYKRQDFANEAQGAATQFKLKCEAQVTQGVKATCWVPYISLVGHYM